MVNLQVEDSTLEAFTYIVPESSKQQLGVIAAAYLRMLNDALEDYPLEFVHAFWKSTESSDAPIVDGAYTFVDPEQNRASGR